MRYGIEVVPFGESGDARTRAAKLDEALTILARLWSGEPVTYHGQHDTLEDHLQSPRSIQKPRIPVWIGGESIPALRRAARWDGWIMGTIDENCNIVKTPQEIAEKVDYIRKQRSSDSPFEIAVDGITKAGDTGLPKEYADAGATWWFESLFGLSGSYDDMMRRIVAGPPR